MLTNEQVNEIKKKLIDQIEASFPEEKKQFAISQIEGMDSHQLEDFMVKNGLVKGIDSNSTENKHCVFCSIISGNISSHKVAENSEAIAVLEINPISKGHVIIIPKEHITSEEELPKGVSFLSKKVSSLIKSRLKSKGVNVSTSNIMGHEIFNIIPFYQGQPISQERKPASKEELDELQKILLKKTTKRAHKKKESEISKIVHKIEEKLWLPKRIP